MANIEIILNKMIEAGVEPDAISDIKIASNSNKDILEAIELWDLTENKVDKLECLAEIYGLMLIK